MVTAFFFFFEEPTTSFSSQHVHVQYMYCAISRRSCPNLTGQGEMACLLTSASEWIPQAGSDWEKK